MKSIYESGFLGDFDVEKLYYKVRTFYRGTKLYQNSRPNTCFQYEIYPHITTNLTIIPHGLYGYQ